jgi:hypothetical protein
VQYWRAELHAYEESQRVFKASHTGEASRQTLNGDEIVRTLRTLLRNGFGVRRSDMQVKIHQAFIEAMLPKLYQSEWDENKARILIDFGLNKLQQEVLIVMPRRRGKTYSVAMAAAAMLLAVPGCSVAVFSTGERLSRALMEVVRMFISKAFALGTVSQQEYKIIMDNKDTLSFLGPDGSKRSLSCLPGTAKVSLFSLFARPEGGQTAA